MVSVLLDEYKQARQGLIDMLNRLGDSERDNEDRKIINSMIRDVEYIIKWLKLGYDPENPKGVNVKDAYNIERHENMDIFPDINEQIRNEREELFDITPEQRRTIIKVVNMLSDRERDCFLLRIQGLTMQEIADELGISIWTARTYIDRANEKIENMSQSCRKK